MCEFIRESLFFGVLIYLLISKSGGFSFVSVYVSIVLGGQLKAIISDESTKEKNLVIVWLFTCFRDSKLPACFFASECTEQNSNSTGDCSARERHTVIINVHSELISRHLA